MMKFRLLLMALVLTLSSQISFAQDSTYISNEYAKAVALYNRAQRYNDGVLTRQALMEMAILSPRDTSVLRSLAELYFNNGQYVSSAMVSMDMVKLHPNNMVALEIAALSYESLRLYDKAIEQYEAMWLNTENTTILYQITYLQYMIDRYEEAKANLNILQSKIKDGDKISLSKQDGSVQEVAFAAALQNLRGLIAKDQGNVEAARTHFTKALEITPEFEAAKNSLAELNKG
ncbi:MULTISPECIES: tetratricopeptide repeat protein [Roseivirga]|jgi:tetratricopeptide (TPR) repeat protein|uniref:Tetratricopeptide repeat protein n=1 Tax=Roseivirga thermotolerans TaxID=1758176 RepID=A0ABQ3I8Y7_9BACT|nr:MULTISPECIES: tetratricopeptide repeat protein [Roseivirga]MEC7754807.1 tetratricopeptide repeat protein [Bacteroidota bacterium]GHE68891.1 hypothetical protein GCM10011340_25950 [Roseivirga thermotolerans]|tara:strand:- start:4899 stop:5594 length:696 start_codon:yes stop_codon:yes gene_type:complete